MRDFDGASFGREIVSSVKEYISPVVSRLDALEKSHEDRGRRAADIEATLDAKITNLEAQVEEANNRLPGLVAEAVERLPPAKDGKSVDLEEINLKIQQTVQQTLDGWERPKDGEPGKDAEPVQVAQVVEALRTFDLDAFIKDAISLGSDNGGIDVTAPADVAMEMSAAISLLSQPAPVTKTVERGPDAQPLRPRTFRFDRDDRGLITAAHEDYAS